MATRSTSYTAALAALLTTTALVACASSGSSTGSSGATNDGGGGAGFDPGAGGGATGTGGQDDTPSCDDAIAIDEDDAEVVAKALGLCRVAAGPDDWGLVSARWALPDGSSAAGLPDTFALGHGVLTKFGLQVRPREGAAMVVLSSGTARQPGDPGYESPFGFGKGYSSAPPTGFPVESEACPGVITGEPHDGIALEVVLRAPPDAEGLSFDFRFFTYEWPNFVCSIYNDFFVALMTPPPAGLPNANVSFDSLGNPVSVNAAFLEVCGCAGNPPNPCLAGGKEFACPHGNADLVDTGFGFLDDMNGEDHGATKWLQTTAPVAPGDEVTLRWVIYDSQDWGLDSTALIDNVRWLTDGSTVGTIPIPE